MLTEIHQFQQWLRRRSPHSSTHIHYVSDLKLFFNWLSKPCAQVTPQDIDAYIAHSQAQGHASATINRRLVALRTFYRYLNLINDDAPTNPVLPQRHYVRRGRRLPRDVEDADITTFFEVITKPRDKAQFLLMLRCGLRVGEVRNLNLHDLYLQPQPGHLPRLWLRGKGGVERVAYLSAQALAALEAWLTIRPTVKTQAVFINCRGRRFTVTGIQYILAQYCHHAGLWLTCHQLRHTFARHLVEAGVPVTTIQRLLGHARLRTTELYLHISDTQLQADYRAAMQQLAVRLTVRGGE
ncbi:MAG: tyrosine-type recombinase/integrase [Anaerolineales bacterium]|nr:tyrosine-type recombinase/integrase [Anaerolineales bacterium]